MDFYEKGIPVFDESRKNKIKTYCQRCWWHDGHPVDSTFTGYILNGEAYDVCASVGRSLEKKIEGRREERIKGFENFKSRMEEAQEQMDDFIRKLDKYSEVKNKRKQKEKILVRGYVLETNMGKSNKKSRRFKKDNRRYITDQEVDKLKEEVKDLEIKESHISKQINIEDLLYDFTKKTEDMTLKKCNYYRFQMGREYSDIYPPFKNLQNLQECCRDKINGISYQDMSDTYRLQKKKIDFKESDISVYQETLKKVKDQIMKDKQDEEKMTVLSRRKVTHKAKYWIDENGNRVELDSNIKQEVVHV